MYHLTGWAMYDVMQQRDEAITMQPMTSFGRWANVGISPGGGINIMAEGAC